MNLKEIKEVIQLMNENGLSELEMEKDGLKVRLKKGPSGAMEQNIVYETRSVAAAARGSEPPAAAPAPATVKGTPVKNVTSNYKGKVVAFC